MFFVCRIFSALFSGTISRCYGFKISNKTKYTYSLVIICFNCLFPGVRTVHFDAEILFLRINGSYAYYVTIFFSSAAYSMKARLWGIA